MRGRCVDAILMQFWKIQALKIRHDFAFMRWFAYQDQDFEWNGLQKGMDGLSSKFCTLLSICQVSIGFNWFQLVWIGFNWSTIKCKLSSRYLHCTGPGRGLTFPPVPPDRSGRPKCNTPVLCYALPCIQWGTVVQDNNTHWPLQFHRWIGGWQLTMLAMSNLQPEDRS